MSDSLAELLHALRASTVLPDQQSLCRLSDLDALDTVRLAEVFVDLPLAVRQQMVTRLVDMAEADFELNFSSVFRLGLVDSDASVRAAAIDGLWEDEDVRLVPMLVNSLLKDSDALVRASAATSLGRFILMGELQKIRPAPQQAAYCALLTVCQAEDSHTEVRRRALESLSYAGTEIVRDLIQDSYDSAEEKLCVSAVFAMGRSADERWQHYVRQEMQSASPEMRYEATRASGELQIAQVVPELEELTDDVDAEVREAALWALGQIGGQRAREILERCCLDQDEAKRTAAEAALNDLRFLQGDLLDLLGAAPEPDS